MGFSFRIRVFRLEFNATHFERLKSEHTKLSTQNGVIEDGLCDKSALTQKFHSLQL